MKAFPASSKYDEKYNGMDLRDYFAAKASEEDIEEHMYSVAEGNGHIWVKTQLLNREQAKYAYADAMMKARATNG